MENKFRAISSAFVDIYAFSLFRAPVRIGFAQTFSVNANYTEIPQLEVGSRTPYELVDGPITTSATASLLTVPKAKLVYFGLYDPRSPEAGMGEALVHRLFGMDGANFIFSDSVTQQRILQVNSVKVSAASFVFTRGAIAMHNVQMVAREAPILSSELI